MVVTNVTASAAVLNRVGTYHGFSLRETTGSAAALVRVFDDPDSANGTVLDEIALSAGESAREYYSPGLPALTGVYYQLVSGAATGSLRTAAA